MSTKTLDSNQLQTQIQIHDSYISIKVAGKRYDTYSRICKSFLVRRYDRATDEWHYPIESSPLIIREFNGLPDVVIDLKILAHANRLEYLALRKLDLPRPDFADLTKTLCLSHQAQWLAWASNFKACANLCEQGTGKTKMALDWLDMKECRLVLIVCRNSNVHKWGKECVKHSDYRPYLLRGARQDRIATLNDALKSFGEHTAVIINYEYVFPFLKVLSQVDWSAVVLDESTAVKSTATKRSKALCELSLKTKYKLILTGTPLINSPLDAFGQFQFLNPNIFGRNLYGFKNRYLVMGGFQGYQILGYKNLDELKEKINRFSFRVLKKDCLDLPPKVFEHLNIEPIQDFKIRYDNLVKSVLLEIGDHVLDNTLAISKINRCLQMCDGFLYTPAGEAVEFKTPKDDELISFLEDHFLSKDKVIIWCYFRATLKRLSKLMQREFPHIITKWGGGETPVNDRSKMVDWFNESYTPNSQSDCNHSQSTQKCLILQSTAFMHGIDLNCDTAIYYSRSWNNEEWLQTQDRIHGINRGGGESANYIIMTIDGTVENSVHKALERKKSMQEFILQDTNWLPDFLKGMIYGRERETNN